MLYLIWGVLVKLVSELLLHNKHSMLMPIIILLDFKICLLQAPQVQYLLLIIMVM